MTILWNEVTILWNEVTILWNEVTKGWNEVAWNEATGFRRRDGSAVVLRVLRTRKVYNLVARRLDGSAVVLRFKERQRYII